MKGVKDALGNESVHGPYCMRSISWDQKCSCGIPHEPLCPVKLKIEGGCDCGVDCPRDVVKYDTPDPHGRATGTGSPTAKHQVREREGFFTTINGVHRSTCPGVGGGECNCDAEKFDVSKWVVSSKHGTHRQMCEALKGGACGCDSERYFAEGGKLVAVKVPRFGLPGGDLARASKPEVERVEMTDAPPKVHCLFKAGRRGLSVRVREIESGKGVFVMGLWKEHTDEVSIATAREMANGLADKYGKLYVCSSAGSSRGLYKAVGFVEFNNEHVENMLIYSPTSFDTQRFTAEFDADISVKSDPVIRRVHDDERFGITNQATFQATPPPFFASVLDMMGVLGSSVMVGNVGRCRTQFPTLIWNNDADPKVWRYPYPIVWNWQGGWDHKGGASSIDVDKWTDDISGSTRLFAGTTWRIYRRSQLEVRVDRAVGAAANPCPGKDATNGFAAWWGNGLPSVGQEDQDIEVARRAIAEAAWMAAIDRDGGVADYAAAVADDAEAMERMVKEPWAEVKPLDFPDELLDRLNAMDAENEASET